MTMKLIEMMMTMMMRLLLVFMGVVLSIEMTLMKRCHHKLMTV